MLACIYEALLADKHIDPNGKTEEELMTEVRRAALKWARHRPMMMSTDFRHNLLTRARTFKRGRNSHEAILYYATWFEHWINGVLLRGIGSLREREANQMIRDVSLRGKYSWLLALTHGKRLPERHVKAILQICDLRNEFVHYKFKIADVDSREEEERLRSAHGAAEKAVRYLQEFEERHFFKGPARSLLRKLRNTKHERPNGRRGLG